MITTLYEHYLWLVGYLKDNHKLRVEPDHRDIHTFFRDKTPLFKLFYGKYTDDSVDRIVVSFHINITATDAIELYLILAKVYPPISVTEVYVEDDRGETYLGEDATKIHTAKIEQQVLKAWSATKKDKIKTFVDSKVVGRIRDSKKVYTDIEKATIEFDLMNKPVDEDESH